MLWARNASLLTHSRGAPRIAAGRGKAGSGVEFGVVFPLAIGTDSTAIRESERATEGLASAPSSPTSKWSAAPSGRRLVLPLAAGSNVQAPMGPGATSAVKKRRR